MRNSIRKVTLWVVTFVIIIGSSLGVVYWSIKSLRTPTQKFDYSNPEHKKMLCGPISLSIATGRLGINFDLIKLASQCKISPEGITLRELGRVAKSIQEIKSRTDRLSWDDLKSLDGTAVLFVNNDHFVAVDPRETLSSGNAKSAVRIYDENKPAQWMIRKELEKIWKGKALTIERVRPSPQQVAGPYIEWDECFIDKGILESSSIVQYAFSFRNVGSSDLTIDSVKKSCGCAKYTLTTNRLAPGQAGIIEASVDLHGKKGYFSNNLAVKTNDTANPLSVLRMAVGVRKEHVLSTQMIRLTDLPKSGKVTGEFYASDPGFGGLEIRDVFFEPASGQEISKHLTCSITRSLLGDDVQRVAKLFGYQGEPEDYVIRIELEASEKCPVGRFQGEVSVVAEVDDAISTHIVAIKGTVIQDVYSVPGVALITLDGEGAGSATIQLRSHANHDFQIVETWVDSRTPAKIERADRPQAPGGKFILSTLMPAVVAGATPIESAAFFKLHNGTVVSVPIAIFKPPQ